MTRTEKYKELRQHLEDEKNLIAVVLSYMHNKFDDMDTVDIMKVLYMLGEI